MRQVSVFYPASAGRTATNHLDDMQVIISAALIAALGHRPSGVTSFYDSIRCLVTRASRRHPDFACLQYIPTEPLPTSSHRADQMAAPAWNQQQRMMSPYQSWLTTLSDVRDVDEQRPVRHVHFTLQVTRVAHDSSFSQETP